MVAPLVGVGEAAGALAAEAAVVAVAARAALLDHMLARLGGLDTRSLGLIGSRGRWARISTLSLLSKADKWD